MHELRPVHRYFILFEVTESKNDADSKSGDTNNQNGDGDNQLGGGEGGEDGDRATEVRLFNVTADVGEVTCELDNTGHKCKHVVSIDKQSTPGTMYRVIVCAENEFGTACGDPMVNQPTPQPLTPNRTPNNDVVWIVIGVVVGVLLCCLLWVLVALICCCLIGGGREKKYSPERKG